MAVRALIVRFALVAPAIAALAFAACSSFDEEAPADGDAGSTDAPADGAASDAGADATDSQTDGGSPEAGLGDATVLAQGLPGLIGVVVNGANDVIVAQSGGKISKVSLAGGGSPVLVVGGVTGLSGIALVGTTLMFTTAGAAGGKIGRIDLSGTTATTDKTSDGFLTALTADTSSVLALRDNNRIVRHQLDLNVVDVYKDMSPTNDIARIGTTLYWTEPGIGIVWKGDSTNPSAVTFASGEPSCSAIAVDPLGVFWTTSAAVRARPLGGADAGVKTISNERAVAIAASDGTAYWLTSTASSSLKKADIADDSGPRQTLASGFAANFTTGQKPIALTSAYVVWITTDGRVLRHDR